MTIPVLLRITFLMLRNWNGNSSLIERLSSFYRRINSGIKQFCHTLKEKIRDDLYVFSEDRLKLLAKNYHDRTNDDTNVHIRFSVRRKDYVHRACLQYEQITNLSQFIANAMGIISKGLNRHVTVSIGGGRHFLLRH